jgi:hypothetical protein
LLTEPTFHFQVSNLPLDRLMQPETHGLESKRSGIRQKLSLIGRHRNGHRLRTRLLHTVLEAAAGQPCVDWRSAQPLGFAIEPEPQGETDRLIRVGSVPKRVRREFRGRRCLESASQRDRVPIGHGRGLSVRVPGWASGTRTELRIRNGQRFRSSTMSL